MSVTKYCEELLIKFSVQIDNYFIILDNIFYGINFSIKLKFLLFYIMSLKKENYCKYFVIISLLFLVQA